MHEMSLCSELVTVLPVCAGRGLLGDHGSGFSLFIHFIDKKDFVPNRWKYFEQNSHLKRIIKCFHHGRLTPLSTAHSPVLFDCERLTPKDIVEQLNQ